MPRIFANAWWLLALCGVLDALHAAVNLVMMNPAPVLRQFAPVAAVRDMGLLALAAGACALVAGLWSAGKNHSWLLSLHGLALGAFGAIAVSPTVKGPLSFRPISLLFLVMAASIGAFAFETAGTLRPRWFLFAAGAVSFGFALSFVAVGFALARLEPPYAFFIWMASFFALCALFFLWLSFRVRGRAGSWSPLPCA